MLPLNLKRYFSISFHAWLAAAQQCNPTNKCPQNAPCCSRYGYCGNGPAWCLGPCDPVTSFRPSSCQPMPKCRSQTIDFRNGARPLVSAEEYQGDPQQAALIYDGVIVPTSEGLVLQLAASGAAQKGTRVATTRYWYYGNASAVMKHRSWAGVVNTFVGMSGTNDEIDWEFTTASPQDVETNWYWFGRTEGYVHGYWVPRKVLDSISPGFKVDDWHTYSIDWRPDRLLWLIDGKVIRTQMRSDTLNKQDGLFHYPSSPMRLEMSIWGAGDGSYPQGTIDWAGGRIDWSKAPNGTFTNVIQKLTIACADPADVRDSKPNYAFVDGRTNPLNGQPLVESSNRSSIFSRRLSERNQNQLRTK